MNWKSPVDHFRTLKRVDWTIITQNTDFFNFEQNAPRRNVEIKIFFLSCISAPKKLPVGKKVNLCFFGRKMAHLAGLSRTVADAEAGRHELTRNDKPVRCVFKAWASGSVHNAL